MEEPATLQGSRSGPTESCFDRTYSALSLDDVYEIAKVIGTEVEKLIDGYGKESVLGLVPRIVKVLELLESFVSTNHAHKLREEELLKTFEAIQLQQQKKQRAGGKEGEEGCAERSQTRVRDNPRSVCCAIIITVSHPCPVSLVGAKAERVTGQGKRDKVTARTGACPRNSGAQGRGTTADHNT